MRFVNITLAALLAGAIPAASVPMATAPVVVQAEVSQDKPPPIPFVLMTPGDSITANGGWQIEFCRILLKEANLACDIRNVAVGATQCEYWPSRIGQALIDNNPDLVVLACGTNDAPWEYTYGEPETRWAFRATVEQIHNFRTPAIPIVPVLIQYADPLITGSAEYLQGTIPATNDNLYVSMMLYPSSWFPGIVNWQKIPANGTYTNADGFHPNAHGQQVMGRIVYDTIHAGMGWPPSSEPPLCGMHGHRKPYPRPSFIPC